MSADPDPRAGVPAAVAKGGIVLAAVALSLNVFKFRPAAPLDASQWGLLAVGGLAALGGSRAALRARAEVARFALVAVQVGLLAWLIHAFQIESPVFHERLIPLAALAFVVNHVLPVRWRLPFFALLSFTGIYLVFGETRGAWLVGFGAALIGICEIPVPFALRIVVLVLAGAVLALMRSGVLPGPWPEAIWPILGSMFMFRLVVYVYDLKHRKEPFRFWRALSYFFMFPNLVFPLFPVVDYATFGRTYYEKPPVQVYRRGVRWGLLGVLHLIAYRFVYQHLTMSPGDVTGTAEFGRYVTANFLLYFRVSGQFHLVVGLLHLFGFHLPETHHRFFYSSGFNDFWRRINIYWKDFMVKVVYFPTYFRLRKISEPMALIVATLCVFLVTWLTHSYQWFWILGEWLISLTDMLFWAVLAVFVVANTFWEMRHGRNRAAAGKSRPLWDTAKLALRTAAFFAFISVLWSLWTAPTLDGWLSLIRAAALDGRGLALIAGALLGGAAVLTAGFRLTAWMSRAGAGKPDLFVGPGMVLILALSSGALSQGYPVAVREFVRDLRVAGLNRQDQELLQRGYYEKLTKVNRFNSRLWEVYARRGRTAPPEIRRPTGDFQGLENIPLLGVTYKGQPLRTNRWGMRDRDYEKVPPPDTFRIALMGASYVMGSGVGDGETFEWLLEERLDREAKEAGKRNVEILNFAVGTLSSAQQLYLLQHRVLDFRPDAVLLVCPATDADLFARHLFRTRDQGIEIPYEHLREVTARVGIDSTTTEDSAMRLLAPVRREILSWVYREFADECRAHGVIPLWAFLSLPGRTPDAALIDDQVRAAKAAGFRTFDLRDVYDGHDVETLQVAPWDWHPNPEGHRLIADRLYRDLHAAGGIPD